MPNKATLKSGENQGKSKNYRQPPKEYQWKKGQSGNPYGKPEGTVSLTTAIKRRLKALSPDNKRTALDWLADNIIQDALDSSDNMRKLIWNYLDGMPKANLDIEHKVADNLLEIIKQAHAIDTGAETESPGLPEKSQE